MKYSALFVTLNGKFADMYGEFRRDVGHFLAVSECDLGVPKSVAIATKLQRAPTYQKSDRYFWPNASLRSGFSLGESHGALLLRAQRAFRGYAEIDEGLQTYERCAYRSEKRFAGRPGVIFI